ncbi:pyridoxal-dependent decarboxylase [Kocuria palustris]|uniref:pyridoxal phosphate-dependent decarboxylase family protein n=1 Tax=Kocuria palustris TaxID=71999 RepID=UPI0021B45F6E|nr:pyridoxal-dependent decarboxylase [Kocuria palustris]
MSSAPLLRAAERPASPLLHAATATRQQHEIEAAAQTALRHLAAAGSARSSADHADLSALIEPIDLDAPLGDVDAALRELEAVWLPHAVWFHHPRTAAHLNCPVATAAVAAETMAAAVNTSVDTWDQSTAATLIERRVLAWTAERLGFRTRPADDGPEADGMFTPGGTTSTLQALMIARDEALERTRGAGGSRPERAARLRILASAESHFSVRTAAHVLGLDDDAVVTVACDASGRMRPDALAAALAQLPRQGLCAAAVVATAGTTDRGAIDPLEPIARICREHGAWLHVDAAYGGGLLTSATHRRRLAGIEQADSVTLDFHKMWFQPVACSTVIVRDARTLRHCTHHAAYLNPADTPEPNQVDRSLQTTRRFDALKIWTTLRAHGADALGALVDRCLELAQEVAELIEDDERFELVCPPSISTVLFRWRPPSGPADPWVRPIRRLVWDRGQCTVAETVVGGRPCLKLTLLNPEAGTADLAEVLEHVHAAGADLTAAARQAVSA